LRIVRLFAIFALLLLAACSTPEISSVRTSTPPQSLSSTDTPSSGQPAQKVVEVSLIETSSYSAQADITAGGTAHLRLSLEPVLLTISPASVSTRAWAGANLKDMQVCFGLDQPCSLDGQAWKPFQAGTETDYPVEWLGSRTVYTVVQVRDSSGAIVPTFLRYGNSTEPQAQASYAIVGHIDSSIPTGSQPAYVQTAIAATQAAFPLTGSVIIQDGRCCVGGVTGTTVQVQVDFSAQSSSGKVTDMRVSQAGCQAGASSLDAPWEPFAAARDYPVNVAINWTSFTVGVQYRDDQGNLSPVYCANIGVEGSPPVPTP
jgi:hypothetical protein